LEKHVIVIKTELGLQVMKDRSIHLSAQQRSALILCDGKRTAQEVLRLSGGMGVTMQDLEVLASKALILLTQEHPYEQLSGAPKLDAEVLPMQTSAPKPVDFRRAREAAIALSADLGFKGFDVNIAAVDAQTLDQLKKIAPELRRLAGDAKYRPVHQQIFGQPL
jgi:hypothetical protein